MSSPVGRMLALVSVLAACVTSSAGVQWYVVDPTSENPYLPYAAPTDGEKNAPIRIVAAKDEYEPGSFVLVSDTDLGKVQLEISDLKLAKGEEKAKGIGEGEEEAKAKGEGEDEAKAKGEGEERKDSTVHLHLPPTPTDVFPKEEVDLRAVKVWYQAGTSWWSYFGDANHQKLCPELLLHDEDLVKVDEKKQANYARITEKDGKVWYRWLNPPGAIDSRVEDAGYTGYPGFNDGSFLSMAPNFRDADRFAGVSLAKGVHKQLWLTVHVTKDVPAGLYRGEVKIKAKAKGEDEAKAKGEIKAKVSGEGEQRSSSSEKLRNLETQKLRNLETVCTIPVILRVLDFSLPEPCTYLDCNRRFFTRFRPYLSINHICGANGNDRALAEKQMVAILKNFAEHGCRLPSYLDRFTHFEWGRAAGLDFSHPLYEAGDMIFTDKAAMRHDARHRKAALTKEIGWHNPLLGWGDEYGLKTLLGIRDMVKIYEDLGFRFLCNSQAGYEAGSYMIDCWRPPYAPDRSSFDRAFRVSRLDGCELGWYAVQHVGVENPAYCRRQYGYGPYRAGFTFDGNYAHHIHGWNDRAGDLFRPMMLVYGVNNGCLDTIAWEGFREGVDDIRYATLLQRLAHPLVKSGKTEARYAAKKALGLLANADKDDMDLTTLRLEMIRHIEKLKGF